MPVIWRLSIRLDVMNKIRTALIGLGYRGAYLLKMLRSMPNLVEVVGIADLGMEDGSTYEGIAVYSGGEEAYRVMIDTLQPELVVVASPWTFHIEQALYAVDRGCHVALEIKPGLSLYGEASEYQILIDRSRTAGVKVFPLENALFKREILAVWRMVEEGLLGELIHLRGGYRHDLRRVLIDESGSPYKSGEGSWRYRYYLNPNADIYPTHGFAPLALMLGLGRSDRMLRLYSQASRALGLSERIRDTSAMPQEGREFLGDVITTHITTAKGVLLTLTHDTTLPRPRSLDWEVQGTRGIWDGERRCIYVEGLSPSETWEDDMPYIERYEHRYWQAWSEEALRCDAHHRGMDYIMLRAMVSALREGEVYPITLEDLALWCSITPLSRESIRRGEALLL